MWHACYRGTGAQKVNDLRWVVYVPSGLAEVFKRHERKARQRIVDGSAWRDQYNYDLEPEARLQMNEALRVVIE